MTAVKPPGILGVLEGRSPRSVVAASLVVLITLAYVDYGTGRELSFSVFYLLPIAMCAWGAGRTVGIVMSCVSAAVWFIIDSRLGSQYSMAWIPWWNMLVRLAFFVTFTVTLSALHNVLRRVSELAQLDGLTNVANSRAFQLLLNQQLDLSTRYQYPVTLAYVDIDRFKQINDTFGHVVGDTVLATVAATLKAHLRKVDIIGRLGGDEFAVILPHTAADRARIALLKVQEHVRAEMRANSWPVTLSIGAVTTRDGRAQAEALLHAADDLMYEVKNSGRDAIRVQDLPAAELADPT